MDWSCRVLTNEFALACVELEVVLCCCGLYELQYFLASVGCAGEHHCVVAVGLVWCKARTWKSGCAQMLSMILVNSVGVEGFFPIQEECI